MTIQMTEAIDLVNVASTSQFAVTVDGESRTIEGIDWGVRNTRPSPSGLVLRTSPPIERFGSVVLTYTDKKFGRRRGDAPGPRRQ